MKNLSRAIFLLGILSSACESKSSGEGSAEDSSGQGTDGSDGASTGDGGAEDGGSNADGGETVDDCGGLVTARATTRGSCFGMEMQADLELDAATCTYTLSNWSMNHGEMPSGGQVVDGVATLEGGGLEGCTGEGADGHLEGICEDGCVWVIDVG
jgi:hypothetical protein